jgi:sugar phosphate isomerase/epimerase
MSGEGPRHGTSEDKDMQRKRRFSLAHLTLPGCPPPELVYMARRAGYDFVSLRTIPMGLPGEPDYRLATNKQLLKELKTAVSTTGTHINDIENARIYQGVDVKSYLPEMEAAAELGVRCLLTNVWTDDRNLIVEAFAALCELAEPLDMSVNIEFVTWAAVTNIKQCLDIISASGAGNAGIVVDTLHFSRSRCTIKDLKSVPAAYLRFAHLCDGPGQVPATREELIFAGRENRLYVGEGGIDIASVVRHLPDPIFALEIPNLARVRELGRTEHVFRAIEATREYFTNNEL